MGDCVEKIAFFMARSAISDVAMAMANGQWPWPWPWPMAMAMAMAPPSLSSPVLVFLDLFGFSGFLGFWAHGLKHFEKC